MFRYLVQQKHSNSGKKEILGRRPAICREMFLQDLGVEEIGVGYRRTLAAGDNAECIHQQSETQT